MFKQVLRLYPLILLALTWEVIARLGLVRPLFLPALSATLAIIPGLLRDGELIGPLAISLYRAAAGLLLAAVIAVPLGVAIARSTLAQRLLLPLIMFGAPAPKIAFLPLFILWFGIGHFSKIALVTLTTVFPFILAVRAGVEAVAPFQIWAARAMGTPPLLMVSRILLPAALPSLLSGIRVAVPYALVTAFTAEMIGGGGGLGAALVMAQRYFESATVFVDILVMCAVGYVIDLGVVRIRGRLLRWL